MKPAMSMVRVRRGVSVSPVGDTAREWADGRVRLSDDRENRVVVADFENNSVAFLGRVGLLIPLTQNSSIPADPGNGRWLLLDGTRIVAPILMKVQLTLERSMYDNAFNVLPFQPIEDSITKQRFGQLSAWRSHPPDSIRMQWTDGLHGYWFDLAGHDTLKGIVGRMSDVGVPCP